MQDCSVSIAHSLEILQSCIKPSLRMLASTLTTSVIPSPIEVLVRLHDNVIKWKHFPRYWPFLRGIHRSPMNSPHKGQWRRALLFSLICARNNGWLNKCEAGDLGRLRTHYDINVICCWLIYNILWDVITYPCLRYLTDPTDSWRVCGGLTVPVRNTHLWKADTKPNKDNFK